MAELLAAAYTDLRTERIADWELEIRDDSDTQVLRVDGSDPRLTITDDAGSATTSFVFVLSGDDTEVTTPLTVSSSVLYNPSGTPMTPQEDFTPFTLGSDSDEVTITHAVELPQA